jgi:hypothetical protein
VDSVSPHPKKLKKIKNTRNVYNFNVINYPLNAVIESLVIIRSSVFYLLSDNVQRRGSCINMSSSLHLMMFSVTLKWKSEVVLVGEGDVCGVVE